MPNTLTIATANLPAHDGLLRDPAQRSLYAQEALRHLPRLLAAVDRNPLHGAFGCFDRQYWHYRTADFPSEMYQEAVLPLALAFVHALPGNRWQAQPRVRELAVAGIRFAAQNCHRDGSCDDYYPYERALGAAVFSLAACTKAYQTLDLNEPDLLAFFVRRGRWLATHDETGQLANHQALAAVGLQLAFVLTGERRLAAAARRRLETLLSWQSPEGWFTEYGGADPGYHTVTISCLAQLRRLTGNRALDEPLSRALQFARLFLHPDASYAGDYGSRGSHHCYPHGFELLADRWPAAAALADGCLRSIARGTQAFFDDDRLVAHRVANLMEAYLDWSPTAAADGSEIQSPTPPAETVWLPHAKLLVARDDASHTVVSAARGGLFKFFSAAGSATTDTGLLVELADGGQATSQVFEPAREVQFSTDRCGNGEAVSWRLTTAGPMHRCRHETATPVKQVAFRLLLLTLGRWTRGLVRLLLQRRLITAREQAPLWHRRTFEWLPATQQHGARLRVFDYLERRPGAKPARRVVLTTDLQTIYVAAGNIYQASVLEPWTECRNAVESLNAVGNATIFRELSIDGTHTETTLQGRKS